MKILNSLILSILILLSSTIAASEIGFIDTDLIFQKAKFVQTFRENFTEKEKDFNEILQKKSKKIEEAIAKGKPEDEIRELVKKRDKKNLPISSSSSQGATR